MKTLLLLLAFACAIPAWADSEWVSGQVVAIESARNKITLRHGPIKSIKMEAMTMPFKVADASLLLPLKVSDKVRFRVVMRDDELIVSRIRVAK